MQHASVAVMIKNGEKMVRSVCSFMCHLRTIYIHLLLVLRKQQRHWEKWKRGKFSLFGFFFFFLHCLTHKVFYVLWIFFCFFAFLSLFFPTLIQALFFAGMISVLHQDWTVWMRKWMDRWVGTKKLWWWQITRKLPVLGLRQEWHVGEKQPRD